MTEASQADATTPDTPATRALAALGVAHTVTSHGRVNSLEEAAAARGVSPEALLKTLVVRRGEDDYVLVLVPGDRQISWPKLRAHLGVNRLSLPDKEVARDAGTPWPVVADALITSRGGAVSIGGGDHGVGATLLADDLVAVLGANVADVTEAA